MIKLNNSVEISCLTIKDIDEILNISRLSFKTPWSRESLIKELTDNSFARYVVAKKDGLILGYGGLWIIVDEAHVTNIAVHPEYRGTGIGNMLMDAMIDICKLELVIGITLEVRASNIAAKNLYKKFGFIQEGMRKGYYEDNNEDALILWKYFT
ncbi:ribosomal protein S18-alanine N-acetyltransferase [Clostridium sp. JN-9]|uniref:ribosomal protein S18-alanine N-acetyltransferase n=1 Tax=Clostridium sp. JN-9 TaxID=2507159 RepID=UPI000FFE3309|nr:ribosomal protein S18-alanine N-acetyltransferase [Clostridium sp. JN-9]QAT39274.1 ribosomal-protein-alanine N-acetyltransferase [Clostridium sp. JN-9]